MTTIITRAGKGSPLTNAEMDQNLINLNTDKVDVSGNQTIAGTKTFSNPISGSVTGTASNVTGTVAISNGGTGQVTAEAAFNALKQPASETATGVMELATSAEVQAGTDTVRAVTPAGLKSAFTGAGLQSLGGNGWQKLPGGVIVQWGSFTPTGGSQTISLPLAFPTAFSVLSVTPTPNNVDTSYFFVAGQRVSLSTFKVVLRISNGTATPDRVDWIAIGY